jgi:hypothetical protein
MKTAHRHDVWTRALGTAAILLTAAAGFCWLDTAEQDHGAASVDLCIGMIATVLGVALVVYMREVGRSAVIRRWAATPVTVAVLDPPPRSYLST